ncbi:VOC family protein [Nesterenkonia sp. HG001]|uniref:VOC family protein n=1 Tax=Nesterenkonia sp. HG001 TaxID=2983207 RepID=UPI002AC63309|nr:VOC family protein [Nesterenkonia sp. HG001]MDZ5078960.1 VOC family protein [Nesterenkonia sp. HG001]
MTTQTHYVEDVPAVIAWYSDLLDLQPYFLRPSAQEPAYAEFRIGPDEDVASAMDDLVSRGATEVEPLVRREAGFVTGVVRDPFGLVLGLMHSPHWASRH